MIRNLTAVSVDQYELAATVISPDTTIPGRSVFALLGR